jgi:hypothetical protein
VINLNVNNEKVVHFVDFENVHKHIPIDEIARGNHQQVILFVGNEQTIPNEWLVVDYNLTVIRVGRTSKDNLDFHLAAYLGMVHVGRDNSVRFIIWSNDKGFDDLIEHFKMRKRRVERKTPPSKQKKKSGAGSGASSREKAVAKTNGSESNRAEKKSGSVKMKPGDPTIKEVSLRVIQILKKTAVVKRPRKQNTLENHIEHWRAGIGFKHIPWDIVHWLVQKNHIEITDGKVKYNF